MTPAARAALAAAAVVVFDQATKAVIRTNLERGESVDVFPGLDLVNTRNKGIAFGLLSQGGALLAVGAGLALLALLVFFLRNRDRPLAWLPTGLLAGGAAGNLIDRAREGSVTDFIDPVAWPAFNFADTAITLGVVTLIYVLERPRGR